MSYIPVRRRWLQVAVVASAAALVLAGCSATSADTSTSTSTPTGGSASWNAVVAAANKEGSVTVWSAATDNVVDKLVSDFNAKYPDIKVNVVSQISSAQETQLNAELKAGSPLDVDMLLSNSDYLYLTSPAIAPLLAKPAGPNAASYPQSDISKGLAPFSVQPYVIVYNTNEFKKAPTQAELINPKYKGRIGIPDVPTAAVHSLQWIYFRKQMGDAYFTKLAALQPHVDLGFSQTDQSIASGDLWAEPTGNAGETAALKAQGAPISWALPANGTTGFTYYAVAFKKSPDPAAALLLQDFVLSRQGQQVFNGDDQGMSLLPNVKGTIQDPKGLVHRDIWTSPTLQSDINTVNAWFSKTFKQ